MMSESDKTYSRRVLVSGASGFIGRFLSQRLHEQGFDVRVIMRNLTEGPWDQAFLLDLASESLPENILSGVDTIFHLAAKADAHSELREPDSGYVDINANGTRKLLEGAKISGVRRFVLFSSVKCMGEGGKIVLNESADCHPKTPYGHSKLEAERLVLEGDYVPEPVVLRLSMVYGPTHKGNIPRMIRAVAKNRFPPLSDQCNKRSMVHVDDVVQAALLAGEKKEAAGEKYIITDGQTYSTRQIYDCVCRALDKPIPKWTVPIGVLKLLAKFGDGIATVGNKRFFFDSSMLEKLIESACYSSEKIRRELGFRPQKEFAVSLPDIIATLGLQESHKRMYANMTGRMKMHDDTNPIALTGFICPSGFLMSCFRLQCCW